MLNLITQLLTDPGFATGYLGEAINHLIYGPQL